MIKREVKLVLIIILFLAITVSGCLGCSPTSNSSSGSPAIVPNTSPLPPSTDPVTPSSEGVVTTVPTSSNTGPDVITNEHGYIIRSSSGTGDTAQVELNAGKVRFQIKPVNYHAGDTYSLILTSVNEPFSYKSTHKFSGDSGMEYIQITKNIPLKGTYQVQINSNDGWEIKIIQ